MYLIGRFWLSGLIRNLESTETATADRAVEQYSKGKSRF